MKTQLTPSEWEFLSAYLDNQLTPGEKTRLEAQIAARPDLQAGLQALSDTRRVLRSLPRRRAPRSFVLTPETARRVRRQLWFTWLAPAFSFSSVLAAVLLVLSFFFGANPASTGTLMSAPTVQPAVQEKAAPAGLEAASQAVSSTATAEPEATPMIILWGQPLGMGGGGGGDGTSDPAADRAAPEVMMNPEAAAPQPEPSAEPGMTAESGAPPEAKIAPTPTAPLENLSSPAQTDQPPADTVRIQSLTPTPEAAPTLEENTPAPEAAQGEVTILGVQPETGQIVITPAAETVQPYSSPQAGFLPMSPPENPVPLPENTSSQGTVRNINFLIWGVRAVLGAAALFLAGVGFFFWRKSRS